MSSPPVRRADKVMPPARIDELLSTGYCGHLASVNPYGRFECDTSIEYQSVVVFGRVKIVEDRVRKSQFFDALMAKYYGNDSTRPKGFYPRLDGVTVYALAVERITGKETLLPSTEARWPATDNTKSPDAVSPANKGVVK